MELYSSSRNKVSVLFCSYLELCFQPNILLRPKKHSKKKHWVHSWTFAFVWLNKMAVVLPEVSKMQA